jgi:multicomponent Na+:H+ antiporter subunit D
MIAVSLGITWIAAVAIAFADGNRPAVGWTAVAALAAQLVLLCVLCGQVLADGTQAVVVGDWPQGVGIRLRADALGVLFALASCAVTLAALASGVAEGVSSRITPALSLFLSTGLTGLFLTGDVFSFYVFFELSMVSAYGLTSIGRPARAAGAGLILAVVNLIGSFLFLLGIAALYRVTGTLDMVAVAERMLEVEPTSAALIAVVFLVAFAVKLGLFPFHFWLPAVYSSSSAPVAAMLSGALANIAAYGLVRFGAELLSRELALGSDLLLALGAASILYGALQAIHRRDPAEVLAYSAIGQAGYMLVALAVAGPVGLTAAVAVALANSLTKAVLFLGVGWTGPALTFAFAAGAFSVAGVPPTAGFTSKLALFEMGVAEESWTLVALLFAGGALSFVYMFQCYQHTHWVHPERGSAVAARTHVAVTLLLAGAVIALGLWPEPLLAAAEAAAGAAGSPP